MRLQRHGKKGRPFYHIVIADGRAPRDGRFVEKIGTYNPLARPAEIDIDFEKAIEWLNNGASPSDTVKAILSYKGVLYKNHLIKGVAKGALTELQAEEKFQAWVAEKETKINSKKNEILMASKSEAKKAMEHEAKVKQAKADAIVKKMVKEAAAEAAAAEEEVVAVAVAEEVVEAPEVVAEVAPEVVAEVAPEVVAEVAPEVVAEAAPEVVAEAAAEEAAPEATPEA
ncbi:MAG: 30S ribosomal protein S16 [Bacteroidota bacterium]